MRTACPINSCFKVSVMRVDRRGGRDVIVLEAEL
jgi:hypothetical protein